MSSDCKLRGRRISGGCPALIHPLAFSRVDKARRTVFRYGHLGRARRIHQLRAGAPVAPQRRTTEPARTYTASSAFSAPPLAKTSGEDQRRRPANTDLELTDLELR